MSVRTRQPLVPGTQSPIREVPRAIERPEYVWKDTVNEGSEPWVQTPETIEKMRVAGRIAANSSYSNSAIKSLLTATDGMDMEAGLAYELAHSPGAGKDARERIASFGKKK